MFCEKHKKNKSVNCDDDSALFTENDEKVILSVLDYLEDN